ncbi:MAG: hypothetical protein NZL83_02375 [Candidatus Absconditabacterales bacterium]|nr:hypothetical protein [Candidatus Absconditabacterales bacterium]
MLFTLLSGGCQNETLDGMVNARTVEKTKNFIAINMYTRNQYTVIPLSNNDNPLTGPNGSTSVYELHAVEGTRAGTFAYNERIYCYMSNPRNPLYLITVRGPYASNSFYFSPTIPPNLPPLPLEIQNNMKKIQ